MGLTEARALLDFIHLSPSPFHAATNAAAILEDAGFKEIDEAQRWSLAPNERRFVRRADSSLIAFVVGTLSADEAGFAVVGAHTDSPNLRLKPRPQLDCAGYRQLGVEVYGGVLLSTWTDRDLGVSGRLFVDEGGRTTSRLVRVDRPVARVPQLAIHLDREVNDKGLLLNKQKHMTPVVGLASGSEFMDWLAGEVGIDDAASIIGFDLMLHVLEAPALGGLNEEFIFAPRLDNLASCHAALAALVAAAGTPAAPTRVIALHDHEEVGSGSPQGAAGSFLEDVLLRLVPAGAEGWARARARSLLVSADMAHAVHPNYADRHEPQHLPQLNAGPVVKVNANMRYATDGATEAAFMRYCREVDVPAQLFVMRSDLACGSTIGPIISTRLGLPTVDVGNPMLSMHSCREMSGSADHALMIRVLTRHFGA